MQVDDLRRELVEARDHLLTADPVKGRRATDRRIRRHRLQRTGVASLLVLVLIGGGVFLATRGTDDQRVISGGDELPHYLPDPLPEGSILYAESPGPEVMSADSMRAEWVAWTDGPADGPRPDDRIVRVGLVAGPLQHPAMGPEISQTAAGFSGGRVDDVGRRFFIATVGLSTDQTSEILATATTDQEGRLVVPPPQGFREVSRRSADLISSYAAASPTPLADMGVHGFTAYVQDGADAGKSFGAATVPRTEVWSLAASVSLEPTEVDGEPAYLMRRFGESRSETSDGESSTERLDLGVTVMWWVSDDVMLYVTAMSLDDANHFASSIREVDQATWDRFVASTSSPQTASATTMISGTATIAPIGPISTVTVP